MSPTFQFAISVPSAVSSLAFLTPDSLCAGSDNGTARVYDLPSPKVVRAIKSLGSEISTAVTVQNTAEEDSLVWFASGRRALLFAVKSPQLILSEEDAMSILELGEDDEDVLNELCLSDNGKYMAFASDAGSVGVVELSTKRISRMKSRHDSICGAVKFVPNRPSELVSGGYDSAVLHFDFSQGTLLSRYDITAPLPSSGVSLSLPFVLSTAITSAGLFAASTADGRVWLGGGGEKRASQSGNKKRSRKWEGLKDDEGLWLQVAEGPVVAIMFSGVETLITCSLLGTISGYHISRDSDSKLKAGKFWSAGSKGIAKVNSLSISGQWLAVGGLVTDGKGIIEIWCMN
ncbi:WD40 repeat-like protein [Sparassis latifolia]